MIVIQRDATHTGKAHDGNRMQPWFRVTRIGLEPTSPSATSFDVTLRSGRNRRGHLQAYSSVTSRELN
jgi:hypothetical protein